MSVAAYFFSDKFLTAPLSLKLWVAFILCRTISMVVGAFYLVDFLDRQWSTKPASSTLRANLRGTMYAAFIPCFNCLVLAGLVDFLATMDGCGAIAKTYLAPLFIGPLCLWFIYWLLYPQDACFRTSAAGRWLDVTFFGELSPYYQAQPDRPEQPLRRVDVLIAEQQHAEQDASQETYSPPPMVDAFFLKDRKGAAIQASDDQEAKKARAEKKFLCPICFEDFQHKDHVNQLPCGHKFHLDCVKQWWMSSTTLNCCYCQTDYEWHISVKSKRSTPI